MKLTTDDFIVSKPKVKPNGCLDRYKYLFVGKGLIQCPCVVYNTNFIQIIKPIIIGLILSLAVQYNWPLQQLDMNNAFLQGHPNEYALCSNLVGMFIMIFLTMCEN